MSLYRVMCLAFSQKQMHIMNQRLLSPHIDVIDNHLFLALMFELHDFEFNEFMPYFLQKMSVYSVTTEKLLLFLQYILCKMCRVC